MTTESLTITKISAAEGKVLTNGETYAKDVYLPDDVNSNTWTEINESEIHKVPEEYADNTGEVYE